MVTPGYLVVNIGQLVVTSSYLTQYPLPPHPPIRGGVGTSKNCVPWGVQNFLLERGNKPEKEGLMQKQGDCQFFISLQFNLIYCVCGGSEGSHYYFFDLQSFEVSMQDSYPSLYYTKASYHFYISDQFWQSKKNADSFV